MALDLDQLDVPTALQGAAQDLLSKPRPLIALAEMLIQACGARTVNVSEAASCAVALRRAAPTDRIVWSITDHILYSQVPNYHWDMVADAPRNAAYGRAIDALIEPGMTVLEIGAGSGLLAMMAARAGAGHVYTVELDPLMARVARETVARNGYADRVTVIEGHSSKVQIGGALPVRADALIHEVLSADLIGEGVLPTVAHAKAELLTPGALLLPHGIGAAGALAAPPAAAAYGQQTVEGFDLGALGEIGAAVLKYGPGRCRRLSAPVRLLDIDLRGDFALSGQHRVAPAAQAQGTASGVEQWIVLGFPDGTALSSEDPSSHWQTCFHPFGAHRPLSQGQRLPISVDYADSRLSIGLAPG